LQKIKLTNPTLLPKTIQQIVFAIPYQMGELKIRQPLPDANLDYFDPFILLHHGKVHLDAKDELKKGGVGPHPHRGFSPVTFIFKGGIHHQDSRGNDSKIYEGGIQWMHAGMGIIHSERPLEADLEIIQLWVNSPAAEKMNQPTYQGVAKEEIPVAYSSDQLMELRIISGELLAKKGPINTLTSIDSAMIYGKKGATLLLPIKETANTALYILNGQIKVANSSIQSLHLVTFNKDGNSIEFSFEEDGYALLVSGEPINEKIETHGPFVMNTTTQIMESYRDYQMGKMGVLIET